MYKILYILFFNFLLFAIAVNTYSQVDTVCPGDKNVSYWYQSSGASFQSEVIWKIEGDSTGNVSVQQFGDTIIVNWDNVNQGEYYYISAQEYYVFNNQFKCSGLPVIDSVFIWSLPDVDIGDEYEVCFGDTIAVIPYSDNYQDIYLWSDGNTSSSMFTSNEGYIWLEVTNTMNCSNRDTAYVKINNLPELEVGEPISLCGGDEPYTVMATSTGLFFTWYLNDNVFSTFQSFELTEIDVFTQNIQNLIVEVEDENGCKSRDTLIVSPCRGELGIIPTVITPNGDGDNDEWKIERIERFPYNYTELIIEIFDRWGKLVWRSDKGYINNRFKGKDFKGNDLPMDSYFYIMHLNNGGEDLTGHITIVR